MATIHIYRTDGDRLAEHWGVRDEMGAGRHERQRDHAHAGENPPSARGGYIGHALHLIMRDEG
ncbi:hypothetical protein [Tessaracoccus massiliensis]|uniref:hypothetical protein n=1 Tax=Tessaracoccus massiliensis TaxID=1522311 RepID=UPI0015D63B7C|nr:hypothetical protein [Tessaracoccus massiliensis]